MYYSTWVYYITYYEMYYACNTYYSMYFRTVVHTIVRTTAKIANTYYSHYVLRVNTILGILIVVHVILCFKFIDPYMGKMKNVSQLK